MQGASLVSVQNPPPLKGRDNELIEYDEARDYLMDNYKASQYYIQ